MAEKTEKPKYRPAETVPKEVRIEDRRRLERRRGTDRRGPLRWDPRAEERKRRSDIERRRRSYH